MRMLVYEVAADVVDDYVRIGESTSIENLRRLVKAVVEVFGEEYLRSPNNKDISRLLAQGETRVFPAMLGSINWMHWKWKNYPVGSHNDINVLERSSLFTNLVQGEAPSVNYSINGHDYTTKYYLVDEIYSSWPTFVKAISCSRENKDKHFAAAQESTRKNVKDIMKACIIIHNMIVEDERNVYIFDLNYDIIDENIAVSHERMV
ncbi:hypothetical protein HHK36_003060 [Tetracentron sinense]|uniref:Nuclease HARBI1 n=1 Tax=Tetracentron sinense TaxID=13715 RepID=A0A834ZN45_TETSI|nr:hypothetical protein HHK36_003060 [Tetracentron sinense]